VQKEIINVTNAPWPHTRWKINASSGVHWRQSATVQCQVDWTAAHSMQAAQPPRRIDRRTCCSDMAQSRHVAQWIAEVYILKLFKSMHLLAVLQVTKPAGVWRRAVLCGHGARITPGANWAKSAEKKHISKNILQYLGLFVLTLCSPLFFCDILLNNASKV